MNPEDTELTQDADQDVSVDIDWEPKQSKWPILIAVLFVVGLGYGAWQVFFNVEPKPTRILIVVETETLDGTKGRWWGAKGKVSARYADAMAKELTELGFEVFSGSDPEFLTAMEETESFAEEILVIEK